MIRTFFFLTCLLGNLSAFAQSDDSASRASVQAAYQAKGIHFEQVNALVQMIATPESQPSSELLTDFLRTIETAQLEGVPSPMAAAWQDRWMSTYNLSVEQVEDLYKVAVRFAFQPGRDR